MCINESGSSFNEVAVWPTQQERLRSARFEPTMTARHVAALSLLMLTAACGNNGPAVLLNPPLSLSDGSPDANAPLSQWTPMKSFDHLRDCNHELYVLLESTSSESLERDSNGAPTSASAVADMFVVMFRGSRCVPLDDPRLKEK